MGVAAYGHFKEAPPSWAAFVNVLEDRFMPSDIKKIPTEERGRLKMGGDDFNRYCSQFQAYCQHIQTSDELMLVMIFIRGLEITLQHAVQLTRRATLMEAYESAWKAHLGPAPTWKAYSEKTRHEDMERLKTAMHGELKAFRTKPGISLHDPTPSSSGNRNESTQPEPRPHRQKAPHHGQSRNPMMKSSMAPSCNDYQPHHHHQPRHPGTFSTGQLRSSGTRYPSEPHPQ